MKITNDPHWSSLVAVTGPALEGGTVRPFWHTTAIAIATFTLAQTNRTQAQSLIGLT